LTDYVARNFGVSFANDIIPRTGGVRAEDIGKIHLGWNIALGDKIIEALRLIKSLPFAGKDIDVSCRASAPKDGWIFSLRNPAVERIEAMSKRFRVISGRGRVSQRAFYEEMLRSRICVSPFGHGEICWRDFEAMLCRCLLLKADMSHVKTMPDLFVPGVTYVPVKWDYSDLEDKCTYYLENDTERNRIAEQANQSLIASLQADWFVATFAELIASAGVTV
jgi:hypothetical protein